MRANMSAEALPPVADAPHPPRPRRPRRWRLVAATLGAAALAVGLGGLWIRHRLVASLPVVAGERTLAGLSAAVIVERDGQGVPTLRGRTRLDLARATGFVHAQDRFFQMDLLRRRAAGELSALVGPAALSIDRKVRLHRMRPTARRALAEAPAEARTLLETYALGVNAGLAALGAPPFEYLPLRSTPEPWKAEDSLLAALAMFFELHDEEGRRDSTLGVLRDTMPPALFAFLSQQGTEWDAPLLGERWPPVPAPGPDVVDLRTRPAAPPAPRDPRPRDDAGFSPGSNNWAVAGTHTANGGALLANDMHLGIGVPNTWYRLSLAWPDGGGAERRVTGVTLPGTPAVVVGSTGRVAWGFTNSYGDWYDLVEIEVDASDREAYRTPEGLRRFEHHAEKIVVKGGADETLDVVATVWGPVIDKDHQGRPRAIRWTAHEPAAVDLGLVRLEEAKDIEEALAIANRSGTPPQNFVCADANGRIGWTLIGRIPRRVGFTGRFPESWADGTRRWDGWVDPDAYPRVVDPASGRLWTANARVVDAAGLAVVGDGGYDLGARQRQVMDDLFEIEKATVADMLRVQLDDRAFFLARWRDLMLSVVTASPRHAELKPYLEAWGRRATVESVGYRLTRAYRAAVTDAVLSPLTAEARRADPRFDHRDLNQREGAVWALVTAKPPHLLGAPHKTWDELLLAAVDAALLELPPGPIASRTWGERNTSRVRHPLSRAIPWIGRWLDMPPRPLPGDSHMPRFQSPGAGASERIVVSPGREAEGHFHMPGGQSGHPLSPHYADGHEAWAKGQPAPFLPGPTVNTLTLRP